MEYISAAQAAQRWGVSQQRVLALCAQEKISGAVRADNIWLIPADAQKPEDERQSRNEKQSAEIARPFVIWAKTA